jgi:hypothetical protein
MLGLTSSNYAFIEEYAPRIWMAEGELYNPSSVEFFSHYTHLQNIKGNLWVTSNQNLSSPSSTLPYFSGQNVSTGVPVYAIVMPGLNETDPVAAINDPLNHTVVVTYFTLYPYNRGKEFLGTVWDNHVGDIEHVHVYFDKGKPYQVVASYHAWNTTKQWGDPDIEMVNGTNHFVLYSAKGSHGLWFSNGTHVYHKDPVLSDETSRGTAWDTWNKLGIITPYDWSSWSSWGVSWLTSVLRWGDPSTEFPNDNCYFGYCRLGDGPVGFLGKSQIERTMRELVNKGLVCQKGCVWNAGIFA